MKLNSALIDTVMGKLGFFRLKQVGGERNLRSVIHHHRQVVVSLEKSTDFLEKNHWFRNHMNATDEVLSSIHRVALGAEPEATGNFDVMEKPETPLGTKITWVKADGSFSKCNSKTGKTNDVCNEE